MTTTEAMSRPRTSSRIRPLRRRSVIRGPTLLLGRQDDEQAAVVVVGREEVGGRARGEGPLRVDSHRLAQHANAPLQRGGDLVAAVVELQAEHLVDRAPDDLLLLEAGELERAAAGADRPALLVAHEEGRVRRGVVVVEQLEEEREAAPLAALGLTPEAGGAIGGG